MKKIFILIAMIFFTGCTAQQDQFMQGFSQSYFGTQPAYTGYQRNQPSIYDKTMDDYYRRQQLQLQREENRIRRQQLLEQQMENIYN